MISIKGKRTKRVLYVALAACVAVALILSCKGNGKVHVSDADDLLEDTLWTDSLESDADTLLLDLETIDTPLPETVDELFDDFLFSFDQSNRLQRSRILFPLSVINADGETQQIERQEWNHHYMLLHQDYCTVLWNSRRQMVLAQDTSVCDARVDQIYLHSRIIDSYIFHRDSVSRQWMLTEVCKIPFENTDLANFLDFYREFATDSIFQRRHVADPLRYTTTNDDDYEMVEGNINTDQWFEFQPDIPEDILVNIAYGQTYHNAHRMLLQIRGINNGLQTLFVFNRDGERWRLVEYEN